MRDQAMAINLAPVLGTMAPHVWHWKTATLTHPSIGCGSAAADARQLSSMTGKRVG